MLGLFKLEDVKDLSLENTELDEEVPNCERKILRESKILLMLAKTIAILKCSTITPEILRK